MPSYDLLDGIPTQPLIAVADEDQGGLRAITFREPIAQHLDSVFADRGGALLAPFTDAPHMRSGAEYDVATGQPGQLRDAQSGLKCQREQPPVAATVPAGEVRHLDEGLHLDAREIVDRPFLVTLRRHGEDALAVVEKLRLVHGNILEERTDRR